MIKANELRIGNWIYWNIPEKIGVPHKVLAVKSNIPNTRPISLGESYDDFLPISLTPETLEKCGFYWSIYHQAHHKENFEFDLQMSYPTGWTLTTFKKGVIISSNILYIHQLQNLYYALTGEELTFNP